MLKTLAAFCAAAVAASAGLALAQEAPAPPTTTVRDGDADLTCRQMADEAAELSADMGNHGGGLLGRARAVAETGAAILIPGAGLAMAGADALTTSSGERREAEAGINRDRWNYLNGLYAGKGCDTAETTSVADSAPAPAVPAPTITPAMLPR